MPEAPTAPAPAFNAEALMAAAAATPVKLTGVEPQKDTQQKPEKPAAPQQKVEKQSAEKAPQKSKVDAMPEFKTPNEEAEQPTKVEGEQQKQESDDSQPEESAQKKAWNLYKSKANELDQIKPEYEKIQAKLKEYEAKPPVPEELQKEIDGLRKFKAAYDLESDPHFQKAVTEPWNEQMDYFRKLEEFTKVPADKILAACMEANPFARAKAIAAVMNESEEDVSSIIGDVTQAAKELHKIGAKERELKAQAMEIQTALKGEKEQMTNAEKAKVDADHKAAASEVIAKIGPKFEELFKKHPELRKEFEEAPRAETPMDVEFHARMAVLGPSLATAYMDAMAELRKMQKAEKARIGSRPSLGDSQSPQPKEDGAPKMSLMEAGALTFGTRRF